MNGNYCQNCRNEYQSNTVTKSAITKNRSVLWYALPIIFAIFGGVIAFFVLKKSDPKKARNCLLIGIGMVILGIAINVSTLDSSNSKEDGKNEIKDRLAELKKIKIEQDKIAQEETAEAKRQVELVKQEESKTEPIEIDKEEQVLSFIKNYKGTDNSGFTLMDAIAMMLNVMYPGEDIISSPATSGYLVASSDYRKEISDRYWKVELNLDLYDGEIYFEWIVDTETNSVSPGNQLGKDVLTLLDIKG